MNPKISIVMAYHNRRKLFIKTLESLSLNKSKTDFEIVVVDDASQEKERIDDLPIFFDNLDLKIFKINPSKKWWTNPCIPHNIGFGLATGDVVIIQNPECLHLGNIVDYTAKHIKSNKYLIFGCYAINKQNADLIQDISADSNFFTGINQIIKPLTDIRTHPHIGFWYQHSKLNTRGFHFCSAITYSDLMDLGGFDEKFAKGVAKDDKEFVCRIKKKKMNISMIDNPFVVHQYHKQTSYSNNDLVERNNRLFNKTNKSRQYKVHNKLTENLIKDALIE